MLSGDSSGADEAAAAIAPSQSRIGRWTGIAAALLAIVAAGASWIAYRATRPVDRPLMRFSADLGPEAVEGPRITAAISPDGTRLAFAARGPAGNQQLATRLLNQAQATLLAGTENAADPFFSPDGRWIGFFASGKMSHVRNLTEPVYAHSGTHADRSGAATARRGVGTGAVLSGLEAVVYRMSSTGASARELRPHSSGSPEPGNVGNYSRQRQGRTR